MPTDPDGDIEQQAAVLRTKLTHAVAESGYLTDPAWVAACERVPRHVFVPTFYDQHGRTISRHDPETREQWLAGVYDDRTLVSQRTNGTVTSSSTMPSLVIEMLEALQATDGMSVLEIGTGTGYNAALLAHRLGDGNVTTVDLTDDLTVVARTRLAEAGYRPRVVTGDGAAGYPPAAPYGRVLATCGLTSVPLPWVEQLTDDGLIVAPLGLGMARIRRTGRRSAEGRFMGSAAFMPLRHSDKAGLPEGHPKSLDGTATRLSTVPTAVLVDMAFRFLVSIVEPGLVWQYELGEAGVPVSARVWSSDGSIAGLDPDGTVAEAGPRCLWANLEATYVAFRDHGRPELNRYGITVDGSAQHVWLDTPDGPRWRLPE